MIIKLVSIGALGLAAHLFWRWHRHKTPPRNVGSDIPASEGGLNEVRHSPTAPLLPACTSLVYSLCCFFCFPVQPLLRNEVENATPPLPPSSSQNERKVEFAAAPAGVDTSSEPPSPPLSIPLFSQFAPVTAVVVEPATPVEEDEDDEIDHRLNALPVGMKSSSSGSSSRAGDEVLEVIAEEEAQAANTTTSSSSQQFSVQPSPSPTTSAAATVTPPPTGFEKYLLEMTSPLLPPTQLAAASTTTTVLPSPRVSPFQNFHKPDNDDTIEVEREGEEGESSPSSSSSSRSSGTFSPSMGSPFSSSKPTHQEEEEDDEPKQSPAPPPPSTNGGVTWAPQAMLAAASGFSTAAASAIIPNGTTSSTTTTTAASALLQSQRSIERTFTLHSAASDRRLPRVVEEDADSLKEEREDWLHPRTSSESTPDVRLALQLDVIAGPKMKTSYVSSGDTSTLVVGRAPDNDLVIPDGEVSGRQVEISWSCLQRCWQVADLGSLNGTQLNGESISSANRQRGEQYRLCTDDIIHLGPGTKLKVSVFPREMLPENSVERGLSLSLGPNSLPRSLTMPKHRIPSFSSLLTPKINSPSKHAVVAAASDELRLECCIASATGRDHARRAQLCEDIALAECPLHGSDLVIGLNGPAALFCVFDGHCGRNAAEAASIAVPDEISDRLFTPEGAAGLISGEGAHTAFHDAFLAADDRINSEEGCTATAVLAWGGADGAVLLQCGNVGDSAALLIDLETGGWKELTDDHRLTNPLERERLARSGIPLNSDSRRLYGLNLARALGDKFLKDEDLGLSAEPAVSDVVAVAKDKHALLLIASDGLWDVLDAEKVAALATQADAELDGSVVETAAAIVAAAKKAGTRDDVTALVVRFWPGDDWEMRSPLMNLDDGQVASFEV